MYDAITDVEGILVGHASNYDAYTGCTVIMCERKARGGVDVRGTASGTRQVDPVSPLHLVTDVDAVLLAGGSSYGLDAGGGAMRYLEEKGRGFDVAVTTVPSVPTAIIFDLSFGSHQVRPDGEMGYAACCNARGGAVEQGSVGVGVGATVGKAYGIEYAMKGGIGTGSVSLPTGVVVGALVVVNAFGDVVDDETKGIMAGARDPKDKRRFGDSFQAIKLGLTVDTFAIQNTTLGVVATNAALNREELTKVAQMAHHAFAKVLSPSHTNFDGDVVFALSLGEKEASLNSVGLLADEVCRKSVKKAIIEADGFGILPSYRDMLKGK